jgi:hypothetical protein
MTHDCMAFFNCELMETHRRHSELGLHRQLRLGSYESAWTMSQKLPAATVWAGRNRLPGSADANETHVFKVGDPAEELIGMRVVQLL